MIAMIYLFMYCVCIISNMVTMSILLVPCCVVVCVLVLHQMISFSGINWNRPWGQSRSDAGMGREEDI